jgi:hypothetical protein
MEIYFGINPTCPPTTTCSAPTAAATVDIFFLSGNIFENSGRNEQLISSSSLAISLKIVGAMNS